MKTHISKIVFIILCSIFLSVLTVEADSPVISVDPDRLSVPYLFLEEGYYVVDVHLNFSGVSDFDTFIPRFSYDHDILEYIEGDGNQTFSFRVNGIGRTNISIENSELLDYLGSPISFKHTNSVVYVMSLEEFVSGEHEKLSDEINVLNVIYAELELDYEECFNYTRELIKKINQLQTENNNLLPSYLSLKVDYEYAVYRANRTKVRLNSKIQDLNGSLSQMDEKLAQSSTINVLLGVACVGQFMVLAYTERMRKKPN
jgi:hypothetical protein